MKKNPTKKALERFDKLIPGISNSLYKYSRKNLSSNEKIFVDTASALILDSEKNQLGKLKKRKPFSKLTQRKTLEYQQNRCKFCGKKLKAPACDFDHIDGNRADNSISNCQALCPNCHARKTRKSITKN